MFSSFAPARRSAVLSLAAFFTFAAMLFVDSAHAEIEEIVVQAQRRDANIQDIGAAITALDQLTMDRRGIEDIDEFQYFVPNLTAGAGIPAFTLRGLGPQATGAAADPGFAIHINGVYAAGAAVARDDFFDLERVELLRGPQGTLYGRNSIAGTMNIVYKKPTMKFETYGDVLAGQFSHQRYRTVVNVPLINNVMAVRFAGLFEKRNGYYETPDQDLNDENDLRTRFSLLYQPSSELSAVLAWSYSNNRSSGAVLGSDTKYIGQFTDVPGDNEFSALYNARQTSNPSDLRKGLEDEPQRGHGKSHFVTSIVEWKPKNLPMRIKSTSGLQRSEFYSHQDRDQSSLDLIRLDIRNESWAASTELEIASNDENSPLQWVAGVNYWHESLPSQRAIITNGEDNVALLPNMVPIGIRNVIELIDVRDFILDSDNHITGTVDEVVRFVPDFIDRGRVGEEYPLGGANVDTQIKNYNWAFFGETSYEWRSAKLTAGIRYGVTEKEFRQDKNALAIIQRDPTSGLTITDPITGERIPDTPCANNCKGEWDAITWKVALDYDVPENFLPGLIDSSLPYFVVATGHRPGGFNFAPDDEFDEENLTAYEIGVKNTMWGKRVELNVNGFYYDMEDLQTSQIGNNSVPMVSNIPRSEMFGIEVEMRAEPISGLRFNFGFGWQKSEVKSNFCTRNNGRAVVPGDETLDENATLDTNVSFPFDFNTPNRTAAFGNAFQRAFGEAFGRKVAAESARLLADTTQPHDRSCGNRAVAAAAFTDLFTVDVARNAAEDSPAGAAGIAQARAGAEAAIPVGTPGRDQMIAGAVAQARTGVRAAGAAAVRVNPLENLKGNTLPRVPELNFSIGVEYEYQLPATYNGSLTGRVDAVWRDDTNFFQFNNPRDVQDAYALVDLRLIYTHNSERFSLEAYVENVGDEDAITNMELIDEVNRIAYLNEPRTYGLKLSARY